MRNRRVTEKTWQAQQQETAAGKGTKQESAGKAHAIPPPVPGGDGTAAEAAQGCYQPRAGAAVCSLLQPFFNCHLFFNKQDASAQADSFPVNSGERGGVGPSHRPGATHLTVPAWVASGAPQAECCGGDRPISFLQPAADEQNKKHVVQAWLHWRGKAELPSCSLFIIPPKGSC